MARSVGNITTGGQLIGIYGGNFVASVKWPLYLSLGVTLALISYGFWHGMSEQEVYFCMMRAWAWAWNWFEFSDTKQMVLNVTKVDRVRMTAVEIMAYPLVANAWTHATTLVRTWAAYGMLFAIPACVGWVFVAERFGQHAREDKFEKGAILVGHRELLATVKAYNEAVLGPRYRAALGLFWRAQLRATSPAELESTGIYRPYTIADVPFPAETEQSHVMLIGSTGKGKTVVMRDLVRQIRERGGRAVIFDLTGAFVESFYDPARDVILNPTDQRCPQWSIFNECDHEVEFNNAAMALIPSTGEKDDFWKPAARTLFVDIAMRLKREGRGTNQALHDELMTAELASLHELAKNTPAAPLTDPDAPKMAEGIRSTFNINARALRLLPTRGPLFSVREWVLNGVLPHAADVPAGDTKGVGDERPKREDGILFLTSRHIDMATTRVLLTLWMDTAVNTLMTMPQQKRLRLWFILDEVGALHRLPSIENGMQAARQYGGAFVLGIHAFAKLADTYGENIAMTLSSYANTKLVMGTADHGTAKWASETIGARMFREMEEGYSYGQSNVRDSVSLTPRKVTEALVIPDQLMKLPKLWGYLVFPEGMPVACVPVRIRQYRQMAIGFEQRALKANPWTVEDAANDVLKESPGHGPDAGQSEHMAVRTSNVPAAQAPVPTPPNANLPTAATPSMATPSAPPNKPAPASVKAANHTPPRPGETAHEPSDDAQLSLELGGPDSDVHGSDGVGNPSPDQSGKVAPASPSGASTGASTATPVFHPPYAIGKMTGTGPTPPPSLEETRKVKPGSADEVVASITAAIRVCAGGAADEAADGGGDTLKDESDGPGGADSGAVEDAEKQLAGREDPQADRTANNPEPSQREVMERQPAFPDHLRRTGRKQAPADTQVAKTPAPSTGQAEKEPARPAEDGSSILGPRMGMQMHTKPRATQQEHEGQATDLQQRAVLDGNTAAAAQDAIDHAHRPHHNGRANGAEAAPIADPVPRGAQPDRVDGAAKVPGNDTARTPDAKPTRSAPSRDIGLGE